MPHSLRRENIRLADEMEDGSLPQAAPDRLDKFTIRTYLSAAGLLALAAALLLGATYLRGIPVIRMLRDPASFYDFPPLSGLLSYAGILLMTSTAAVCAFVAHAGARWRQLLVGVAAFSAYFTLDDLFMLHEGVWPRFGIPEEVIMMGFALALLAILWTTRSQAAPDRPWGLYVAAALMAGSILIDMSLQSDPATVAEDVLKFMAIGVWALFWTGVASGAIAALRAPEARLLSEPAERKIASFTAQRLKPASPRKPPPEIL